MAICGRPQVLFLDEPTVGLDVQAREALWTSIRALLADGCSIVLTTHYLEEAEALADRVAVITKGRVIACGSVDDMRALVARRQISCESQLPLAEVRAWPGVVDAQRDAGTPADHRHRRRRRGAAPAGQPTPRLRDSKCARPDSTKHSTNSHGRLHERAGSEINRRRFAGAQPRARRAISTETRTS